MCQESTYSFVPLYHHHPLQITTFQEKISSVLKENHIKKFNKFSYWVTVIVFITTLVYYICQWLDTGTCCLCSSCWQIWQHGGVVCCYKHTTESRESLHKGCRAAQRVSLIHTHDSVNVTCLYINLCEDLIKTFVD